MGAGSNPGQAERPAAKGAPDAAAAIRINPVQLPKSGGAIPALGEMLSTDGFTGKLQFDIPIAVSPARGLEPSVAVCYRSDSGNGVFGSGFSLSQSSISRDTAKGAPRYDDGDEFLLDGAPLTPNPGSVTTRLFSGRSYVVTAFRPRALGQQMRIEHWVAAPGSGQDEFWRTIDTANVSTLYGRTAAARIADPADAGRIFEWLVEWRRDARGNAVSYIYKPEDCARLTQRPDEARLGPQRYLSCIRYGNAAPSQLGAIAVDHGPPSEWHFEVVFDYGEYDVTPSAGSPYQARRTWAERQDSFSNFSAGFERRTARLCRSIFMFHRFAEFAGPEPMLVRRLAFRYDENPVLTRLVGATTTGFRLKKRVAPVNGQAPGHDYESRALPELTFGYTAFEPARASFKPFQSDHGAGLAGVEGAPAFSLVDLYGEGAPGVLHADSQSTLYRSPRAANCSDGPALTYAPPRVCEQFAQERAVAGQTLALADLDGDGRLELEVVGQAMAGSYRIFADGSWSGFRAYESVPTEYHAFAERADLSGRGRSDLVLLNDDGVRYYPAEGRKGYGAPQERGFDRDDAAPAGAERGNRRASTRFADLLGAGATQRLLLSDGRARVWPSLGRGRFGPAIDLKNAPSLGPEFDSDRLFLADLDGSGATDLIYADRRRLLIWFNQSGNGFAPPMEVRLPGPCHDPAQIAIADVRGGGWDCIVFSEQAAEPRQWLLDACAGAKPYLLSLVSNGMGAEEKISYASSTRFQLEDREAGRPWTSNLPFPVQVISRVEERELSSGLSRYTDYRYRNGVMDGEERAFRGFGLVEQRQGHDVPDPVTGAARPGPVLLTRTWYHTGLDTSEQIGAETFAGDSDAYVMPGTLFENGATIDGETRRQAFAALAGSVLRMEVYGLDGDASADTPFSVSQSRYRVRLLQPRGDGNAVFLVGPAESIAYTYDRKADDPQVAHDFTLAVDDDGTVVQTAAVRYPRRQSHADGDPQQDLLHTACAVLKPMKPLSGPDVLLVGLPDEERSYALSGVADELLAKPTPNSKARYFSLASMTSAVMAALAPVRGAGAPLPELLGATKSHWFTDRDGALLPQALLSRVDTAILTRGLLDAALGSRGVNVDGYLSRLISNLKQVADADGVHWRLGAEAAYADAAGYYRLSQITEPAISGIAAAAGSIVRSTADRYGLLVESMETSARGGDAQAQTVRATYLDYQLLAPLQVVDANGVVQEFIPDPLGAPRATSRRGKEWTGTAAVDKGFAPLPLDEPSSWPMPSSASDLAANPERYLAGAETVWFTQLGAAPVQAVTVQATDYPTAAAPHAPNGVVEVSVSWSDGWGQVVQTCERTGPGQWRIDGCALYLGDGSPWRHFHPYYGDTPNLLTDRSGLKSATTLHYDVFGRVVRVSLPKGDLWEAFFTTTAHGAWQTVESDVNDTLVDSDWYKQRSASGSPAEQAALKQAAGFNGTPTTTIVGSNGLPVRLVRRLSNTSGGQLVSRHRYDAAGRVEASADARLGADDAWNFESRFLLTGEPLLVASTDAGQTINTYDHRGLPWFVGAPMDRELGLTHDSFGRLIQMTATDRSGQRTVERLIYGDSLDIQGKTFIADGANRNLSGQVVRHYDPSGLTEVDTYTITGEPLAVSRAFLADPANDVGWAQPNGDWAAQAQSMDDKLATERFVTHRGYDALGRPVSGIDPGANRTDIEMGPGGRIRQLSVTPSGGSRFVYLDSLEYAADGARLGDMVHGPSAPALSRLYTYDDDNRRLVRSRAKQETGARDWVQDLSYVYDPVGNVTQVSDACAPSRMTVPADRDFTYDALYRLTGATGRAHSALTKAKEASGGYEDFFTKAGAPTDPNAIYRYSVTYGYDTADNLIQTRFTAPSEMGASWTRRMTVDPGSNRAVDTDALAGKQMADFFDAAGNQTVLDGLAGLGWDHRNLLHKVTIVARGGEGGKPDDEQFIAYDGSGQKVRKTTRRLLGSGELRVEDTFYFGGLEIARTYSAGTLQEECQRLKLEDENATIAERITWTVGRAPAGMNSPQHRIQLEDRQGSSTMELDETGRLVSYEEYAPYGTTVYASGPSLAEVSLKRYRFSRKERDPHTGLYDYGARHYAPWLGRWLSPDPIGTAGGPNLYAFVGGNPVTWVDVGGLVGAAPKMSSAKRAREVEVENQKRQKLNSERTEYINNELETYHKNNSSGQQISVSVLRLMFGDKFDSVQRKEKYGNSFHQPIGNYIYTNKHGDSGRNARNIVTAVMKQQLDPIIDEIKNGRPVTPMKDVPAYHSNIAMIAYGSNVGFSQKGDSYTNATGNITNRIEWAWGRVDIDGSVRDRDKRTPRLYSGEAVWNRDEASHLVGLSLLNESTRLLADTSSNMVSEDWLSNRHFKSAYENSVSDFYKEVGRNVRSMHSIHVPIYESNTNAGTGGGLRSRPKSIVHLVAVNGVIVAGITLKNSKNPAFPHPNRT